MASPGSGAHDRNTGGHDRQGNPRGGDRTGGNAASGMSSAAADHMIATGRIRAPSIPGTGVAKGNFNTQDDAYGAYSKAVGDYATRGTFGRIADFLAGPWYDQNEPMAGNPRSFSGGTWHSSSNPYGAAMGLASPFGSGVLTGPLAGKLGHAAGLPDVWHGGYDQPDVRPGVLGNAPAGTDIGKTFAEMGGTHASSLPGGGADQTAGLSNTGSSNPMAAFGASPASSTPGGAAFGAQPQSPMAAFPTAPKIPNHSLPQGYQSMFPGSLTDQDKALLYAKALA